MTCGSCVTLIEKSLKRKQGVKGASVAFSTGIGVVEYDSFVTSPKDIITAIDVYCAPSAVDWIRTVYL